MALIETSSGKHYASKGLLTLVVVLGLAALPFAEAGSFLSQFSYFKQLKDAETRLGAPEVFAKLETMTALERTTFLEEKRNSIDALMNLRAVSGDATGAAQAAVWMEIANDMPAEYMAYRDMPLKSTVARDALKAIVDEARNRQIVILNEAHHVPFHRVFARELAGELRKIGFEYLAAEAFAVDIPRHPEAVERNLGFYVMEPMYSGFVRSAMRDGWSFVGYDRGVDAATQEERNRLREIGAANNIVNKIFAGNPKAKVFIYVGYGHAAKQSGAKTKKMKSLATLLRETLDIDPLTIDQATMYARGDMRTEHPRYRAIVERFAPSKPIVLRAAAGGYAVFAKPPGAYDMQVVHPDDTMHSNSGRPLWMERQAQLGARAVPPELLPKQGRRLIQAFHVEDGPGAIPADQVMVVAGKTPPALMLPKGQFRFDYEE